MGGEVDQSPVIRLRLVAAVDDFDGVAQLHRKVLGLEEELYAGSE